MVTAFLLHLVGGKRKESQVNFGAGLQDPPMLDLVGFELRLAGNKRVRFPINGFRKVTQDSSVWIYDFKVPSFLFGGISDLGASHWLFLRVGVFRHGAGDFRMREFGWINLVRDAHQTRISIRNLAEKFATADNFIDRLEADKSSYTALDGESACEILLGLETKKINGRPAIGPTEGFVWREKNNLTELTFVRTFAAPADGASILGSGEFTIVQKSDLEVERTERVRGESDAAPFSRHYLEISPARSPSAHASYLARMTSGSPLRHSEGFNFFPVHHPLEPALNAKRENLLVSIQINRSRSGELSTDAIRFFPDGPASASLVGTCDLEFPSIPSRSGKALKVRASIDTASYPDRESVGDSPLIKLVLGSVVGSLPPTSPPAPAADRQFNFGSLLLTIPPVVPAAVSQELKLKRTSWTFQLERRKVPADQWGIVVPWDITGFCVGPEEMAGQTGDQGKLILPIAAAEPSYVERSGSEVNLIEETDGPLLLPLPDFVSRPGEGEGNAKLEPPLLLMAARQVRLLGRSPVREMRITHSEGINREQIRRTRSTRLLYIDRNPFLVALIEFPQLAAIDAVQKGTELAYWSSLGVHRGWQLQVTADQITVWLPPQGIGEGMEKNAKLGSEKDLLVRNEFPKRPPSVPDLEENQVVPMRFTPNAKLTLATGELARNYGHSPTFLRSLLGNLKDHRLVGLPLKSARFEMLYGLTFEIRGSKYLRVAELFSRLGLPARPLPLERLEQDLQNNAENWRRYASAWKERLRVIESRLGVYEVFDDRQIDFDDKGQAAGFTLDGNHESGPVRAWLRTGAKLKPSFPPLNPTPEDFRIPYVSDGLPGSYAWAFESRLLYEALFSNDPDLGTRDRVEAVAASVARLYFSALGGWSSQQASFDRGRAVIAVTVEMGRVSELRVERIGRIGVLWNKAKLVTVFRRSVLGSTQFHDQQDDLFGRPVLRKVEEYVEFIEKHRHLPDPHTRQVDPALAGCLTGCSCDEKIPVDSRWGTDVYREDPKLGRVPHGMRLPLMMPNANPGIYGNATVLLHFHSDPRGGHAEDTARILNLADLTFWADVSPDLDDDTDKWPPVFDVDVGSFAPGLLDPEGSPFHQNDLGAASVPPGAANFTFRLAGFKRGSNLVGHLFPDTGDPENPAPQVESVLRTVTLARGTAKCVDDMAAKLAGQFMKVRSDVESFIDLFDASAAPAISEEQRGKLNVASKLLARDAWGKIQTGIEAGLGVLEKEFDSLQQKPQALLDNVIGNARWALERGTKDFHAFLDPNSWGAKDLANNSFWRDLEVVKGDAQRAAKVAEDLLGTVEGTIFHWRRMFRDFEVAAKEIVDAAGRANFGAAELQEWEKEISQQEWFRRLNNPAGIKLESTGAVSFSLPAILADLRRAVAGGDLPQFSKRIRNIAGDAAAILKQLEDQASKSRALELYRRALGEYAKVDAAALTASTAWQRFTMEADQVLEAEGALVAETLSRLTESGEMLKERLKDTVAQTKKLLGDIAKGKLDDLATGAGKAADDLRKELHEKLEPWKAGIRAAGNLKHAAVGDFEPALRNLRAFGRVPEVPMLAFDGAAKLDSLKKEAAQIENLGREVLKSLGKEELKRRGLDKLDDLGEDVRRTKLEGLGREAGGLIQKRFQSVAYDFGAAKEAAERTLVSIKQPVVALVDRAKDAAGDLVGEAKLKAASIQNQVNQIKERLLADVNAVKDKALGDLFPDFGGLKLEKLLGKAGVSENFAKKLREKTKVTHDFDRQTMTGFVDSVVDNLPLDVTPTLFAFGPMALRLKDPVLYAHVRIQAGLNGEEQGRIEEGRITADWQMCFGGEPLVVFKDARLRCDNGDMRMDLDPNKLEMNGLLKALTDLTQKAQYGDEGDPFQAGVLLELPSGVTAFCRLRLQLPDISGGTFAITNISLGAFFEVSIKFPNLRIPGVTATSQATEGGAAGDGKKTGGQTASLDDLNNDPLVDEDLRLSTGGGPPLKPPPGSNLPSAEGGGPFDGAYFRIAAGLNFASREAPFNITVFILGGCGWFNLEVEYIVPLSKGKPTLSCYLSVGFGASAQLAINLGFASGKVFVSLALEIECYIRSGAGPLYRYGLVLTFAGCLTILGFISVSLVIVLAVRYDNSGLSGEGYVRVRVKICWCFTFKFQAGFTYKFGKAQTSSSSSTETPLTAVDPARLPEPRQDPASFEALFGRGLEIPDRVLLARKPSPAGGDEAFFV